MSLDILILEKQQFSKFQKNQSKSPHRGDQSYPKVAIKVTNIKDINIKILCFFYSRIPPHVFCPKKDAKEITVYFYLQ